MFVSHSDGSESKGDYTKPSDLGSIPETNTEKIE